jgi:hypothetical protein
MATGAGLELLPHWLKEVLPEPSVSVVTRFRKHKGAVKMHTLLDLRGNIPTFIGITEGKVHDVNMLDEILPEAGAFYVIDRAYLDFERLYCTSSRSVRPFSWFAPNPTSCSSVATPIPWTRPLESDPITPSSLPLSTPPKRTRSNCAA